MRSIKTLSLLVIIACTAISSKAQDEKEGGFHKYNLFTGGSVSLGFSTNTFQAGANPFFGYSIAPWIDAGVVANYNYASFRDVIVLNDKLRESTYGGGAFTRLYPIRFLFAQLQFEHNWVRQKYIPRDNPSEKSNVEANSLLVGAGYTSERYPGSGRPFFYLSLLFDILDSDFSPYTRTDGSVIPIIRAGLQVPLFQNSRR